MRFGICCGPGSFVPQDAGQPLSAIPRLMEVMEAAAVDYVEFAVGAVQPLSPESEFEALRSSLAPYPLKVEAFNSFLPASQRITGPRVDLPQVLAYCRTALRRCKALGGEVVVLGSAGARKVPEGFPPHEAEQQLVKFCRELGPVAEEAGITITIEPLNRKEDNLVLSVEHGARLVDEVHHPRIQLLADLYHIAEERESLENVARAGGRLRHAHLADRGRVAPGFAEDGEEDFLGFFRALRRAGYDLRCSFEGSFASIQQQTGPVIKLLRQRWQESVGSS